MALLSPQHAEALTDALNVRENPFVRRDSRRDRHRKQPTKGFAWMSGMLLIIGGIALALLSHFGRHGKGIPWWLGGEFGAFLCIVTVGVHALYVTGAAQKNATTLLTQEAYRNTLATLLMLPTPPFAFLVQSCVYPWLAAMRVAFVLLPVYVFCVGLGGISWLDLVMLYVVFALLSFAVPLWRRPALGDNLIAPTPTAQAANALAQNAATLGTNRTGATSAAGTRGNQSGNPAMGLIFGLVVPFFVLSTLIGGARGGGAALHHVFSRYAPDSILTLLPTFLLSWPLIFARALVTPFDWFGWRVLPLPFVLALFPLSRYLQLVRVSEWLGVGTFRDLALQPTYIPRRRWEMRLRLVQTFVVVGYVWKWAVADGHAAFLTATTGPNIAPGLAGFAYVLLWGLLASSLYRGATVGGWLRSARRPSPLAARRLEVRAVAVYLAAPFVLAFGFYLACCLLARTMPFPSGVGLLWGQMTLLSLSGMVGACAAFQLMSGGAIVITLAAWGAVISGPYTPPPVKTLGLFTTLLGALKIGQPGFFGLTQYLPASLQWWMWPATAFATGLFALVFANLPALARTRQTARQEQNANPACLWLDPTQVGEEVFGDPVVAQATARSQSDTPLSLRAIAAAQRIYDNAIITKELRARLRGKLDASTLPGFFGLMLALTLAGFVLPSIPETFGGGIAATLYGLSSGGVGGGGTPDLANISVCFFLIVLLLGFFSGFATTVTFAQEREKSTLGFLLTTPMSSPAIVVGKAVGLLAPAALVVTGLSVWTLALALPLTAQIGVVALLGWLKVVFTAYLLMATVGLACLALASLFPQRLPSSAQGIVGVAVWIFFQVCVTSLPAIGSWLSSSGLELSGYAIYGLFVLFCLTVCALGFFIALWRVRRMRRGDLSFAASKREN